MSEPTDNEVNQEIASLRQAIAFAWMNRQRERAERLNARLNELENIRAARTFAREAVHHVP